LQEKETRLQAPPQEKLSSILVEKGEYKKRKFKYKIKQVDFFFISMVNSSIFFIKKNSKVRKD